MEKISKIFAFILVILFLTSLVLLQNTAVEAQSKTIVVPDDYLTIQAAIDNASQGDTILVGSGTYYETLVIEKPLFLIGESQKTTFINANNATENIIYINASFVTIENFTISNNKGYPYSVTEPDGIRSEYFSSHINIANNTISSIQYGNGISLQYGSENTIIGNNITNCGGTGIYIEGGSGCSIIDNNIVNNGFGTSVSGASKNNTIVGNYFGNSTYNYGLQINNDCLNNTIAGNTFAYNQYGLALQPPSSNTIYHNNFIQNTFQALLFGRNSDWAGLVNNWDNGKEGNFWSDYDGTEIGHTGIGNSPYPLVANWDGSTVYFDNYPLISPYDISSSFPTPNPTPSPTPSPTASPTNSPISTPSPTHNPTPTATPTKTSPSKTPTYLTVNCKSSTTYANFKVNMQGTLTANNTVLPESSIQLSYSVDGGNSWIPLTLVSTDDMGTFQAAWTPLVSGNYFLRASYEGNAELSPVSVVVHFAVLPVEDTSIFSVASNSTVTGLTFNSANQTLIFELSGETGTTGYVNIYISKSLMSDASKLRVYFDQKLLQPVTQSLGDSWLVSFTYHHSTHSIALELNSDTSNTQTQAINFPYITGLAIVAVLLTVIAALFLKRKNYLNNPINP